MKKLDDELKMEESEMHSGDPMDFVRVALAIETLAYHDKNYLSKNLQDNAKISEEIQSLLSEAIRISERRDENTFEFDKSSADRIENIVENYPMSLECCADVLEFVAPICATLTTKGFIDRLRICFKGAF